MVEAAKISVASARGVAERWRGQYQHSDGKWTNTCSGSSKIVYDKLCALGHSPDINAVANIIGNQGWSYLTCTGCSEYVEKAVSFGRDISGDETLMCAECLANGIAILERARTK